jgi:hypothetical protein
MATYVETSIVEALMARLLTLTLSPALPVAWPNLDYTPPAAGYLRATHVPNSTNQVTLGSTGKNRHVGIFQVDVFLPIMTGISTPMERAGAVAAHFKRGTTLTKDGINVRITRPPEVRPALQSLPYIQVPVIIRYQADADNPA